MKSVVLPFRYGGADSFELRYCLRSIDMFVPDVEDVYLIGNDRPTWYFGSTIPCDDDKKLVSVCRVLKKIKTACQDPRVTEDFWYFNDDMFLISQAKEGPFFMRNSPIRKDGSFHHKGFVITFEELARRGHPKPYLDCELHHPCIYNKTKALKLLNEIDIRQPYSFRTLYFNLLGVQLAPEFDHKRFDWIEHRPNDYCVSCNDSTLNQPKFVEWCKRNFKKPSRWEA